MRNLLIALLLVPASGCTIEGEPGPAGMDGTDGVDGTDGTDGAPGEDSEWDVVSVELEGCEPFIINAAQSDPGLLRFCTYRDLEVEEPVVCTAGGWALALEDLYGTPSKVMWDVHCHVDYDEDGISDGWLDEDSPDNCNGNWNPFQEDFDGDDIGNSCDDDLDGDQTLNNYDRCLWEFGVPVDSVCDKYRTDEGFGGWVCTQSTISEVADETGELKQDEDPLDQTCFDADGQVFLWTRVDCEGSYDHWAHGCPIPK